MVDLATDVVRGIVVSERIDMISYGARIGSDGRPFNVYEIATVKDILIKEVFQGNREVGDVIEVAQFGGTLGSVTLISADFVNLAENEDLVFFLFQPTRLPNQPALLVQPAQAVYRFTPATDAARANNFNAELESVDPWNNLRLTLDDLMQIQEANRARQGQ
jgi:hypothetical protein